MTQYTGRQGEAGPPIEDGWGTHSEIQHIRNVAAYAPYFEALQTVRPAPPPPSLAKPAPAPPPPVSQTVAAIAAPPPPREEAAVDVECYRNYFLVKFKFLRTGQYVSFDAWTYDGVSDDTSERVLDREGLAATLKRVIGFGFNLNGYDLPMITLALTGASCSVLKQASDRIIQQRMKPWEFYREYRLQENGPHYCNTVDLMEVAPGVGVSLKMYAGRMHSRRMQDLPIAPDATIQPHERLRLDAYCGNDLDVTHDLREAVRDRVALRERVGAQYGIDVRSKSDAQIAEAVIKARLGFKPQKGYWPDGSQFWYEAPPYIQYQTPQLQDVLRIVTSTAFTVHDSETRTYAPREEGDTEEKPKADGVALPAEIAGRDIVIGETTYRMGIGGLHSQESKRVSRSIEGVQTVDDSDVASYYPSLILQLGMFPKQLGARFLQIYREIYDERLAAKRSGDKTVADGFKIVLNGTFGKLGSKYSILYSPDLMIRVTLTGQLALLMLAESFELAGIRVVSANTDGIVTVTPVALAATRAQIVKDWETRTGLEMETTHYEMLASRDVNNYVAVKGGGKSKGKGAYAFSGLLENKHPQKEICVKAVHAYLAKGTPVEETIRASRDIRDFIVVRTVKGGGEWGRTTMARDGAKKAERIGTLRLLGWRQIEGEDNWIAPGASDREVVPGNERAYKTACRAAAVPGEYLGKAVRWAYTVNGRSIVYSASGNSVATADNCHPFMTLPDTMPGNIDYQFYITEAYEMLEDLGITSS